VLYCFLVYKFWHRGHCAGGYDGGPNSMQENLVDCRNKCAERSNNGYFAYSTSKDCACYFASEQCPNDDRAADYNAYQILREGIRLFNNLSSKCVLLNMFHNYFLIVF
jgi:hypothetical protein